MSNFKSWTREGKKANYAQTLTLYDLMALNSIAPSYHNCFGYNLDEHYVYENNMPVLLYDLLAGLLKRPQDHIIDMSSHGLNEDSNQIPDPDIKIIINLKKAKKYANKIKFTHKTIVVRLGGCVWHIKPSKVTKTCFSEANFELDVPVYWYEFPYQPHGNKNLVGNNTFAEKLSERPYIHVNNLFEEVEIRSSEKKRRITIDDVLFACRGLCADDTRNATEFNVLSDDGSKLVLQVDIDNWST